MIERLDDIISDLEDVYYEKIAPVSEFYILVNFKPYYVVRNGIPSHNRDASPLIMVPLGKVEGVKHVNKGVVGDYVQLDNGVIVDRRLAEKSGMNYTDYDSKKLNYEIVSF